VDASDVVITGGSADQGNNYTWTITNRYTSPIVGISFPHYRATVFDVPDGWERECTNLLEPGSEDQPGTCTAKATAPRAGIVRGGSADFTLRVWRSGTQRTHGTMTVRFADGMTVEVPGVELPAREAFGDRYVSLLGLGFIFLAWLAIRMIRGKRTARAPNPGASPPESEQ